MKVREIQLQYAPARGEQVKITRSIEVFELLLETWDTTTISLFEEFKALLLDQAGQVLGILPLAKGGVTGCVVDVRLLLASCLLARATRLIVAHNHPSGALRPSQQDILLTTKIKHGCGLLDIELTDHLILSGEGYFSFLDEGLL